MTKKDEKEIAEENFPIKGTIRGLKRSLGPILERELEGVPAKSIVIYFQQAIIELLKMIDDPNFNRLVLEDFRNKVKVENDKKEL